MTDKRLLQCALTICTAICLTATAQDQVLRRVPADCLFCVQVNNLDEVLGRLEQYLSGLADPGLANQARSALGEMLSNPRLTGIKTSGIFVLFGTVPDGKIDDREAWLRSIYLLVPTTDFSTLVANTPQAGTPDPNGVRELTGMGLGLVDVEGYALVGRMGSRLVQMAKSMRSGFSAPLASSLDQGLVEAAARPGLWAYGNVQVLAKAVGPGLAQRIQELGKQLSAPLGPNAAQMEQTIGVYGSILEYLLTQLSTVAVTVRFSPDRLVLTKYIHATPGSQLAQALTRPGPAGRLGLVAYCQDGALANLSCRIQWTRFMDLNIKLIELVTAATGQKATPEQVNRTSNLMTAVAKTIGNEMALSVVTRPGAKPFFGVRQVMEVKDKEAFMKAQREAFDGLYKDGIFSSLVAGQTVGIQWNQLPDVTYKDTRIQGWRLTFSFKDPNGQEAMIIRQMYGDGIEGRIAVVGQAGLIVWGDQAQQHIQEMIDKAGSGSQKQTPSEINAAMDLLETKDVDLICTVNYLRLLGALMGAIMPIPMPIPPSSSNLVIAGNIDGGKATVQVILPKAHLLEIANLFKGMASLTTGQVNQQ